MSTKRTTKRSSRKGGAKKELLDCVSELSLAGDEVIVAEEEAAPVLATQEAEVVEEIAEEKKEEKEEQQEPIAIVKEEEPAPAEEKEEEKPLAPQCAAGGACVSHSEYPSLRFPCGHPIHSGCFYVMALKQNGVVCACPGCGDAQLGEFIKLMEAAKCVIAQVPRAEAAAPPHQQQQQQQQQQPVVAAAKPVVARSVLAVPVARSSSNPRASVRNGGAYARTAGGIMSHRA